MRATNQWKNSLFLRLARLTPRPSCAGSSKADWFPKPYADFVQRLRVVCGFILLAGLAVFCHPTWLSTALGFTISVNGLALRAWATGHLAKDAELATTGPYAYIRNPLYVGTLITALGVVIACRDLVLALIVAVVFLFVYLPAVQLEEQHLREIFPNYAEYAAHVERFVPRSRWSAAVRRFSWAQFRKNEEYKAALGFLIAALWIIWRCWMEESVS
jgi:protein-S-isoprenylcysteine O-methyltransferase Ste14